MRRVVVGTIAVLFLQAVLANAQNTCADVLKSVYDVTNRSERISYSHSFYSFMCDSTYSSYQSAMDAGASLGISINALPISFGGYDRNSQWSQYQRTICTTIRDQTNMTSDLALAVQRINTQVIDAWKACVISNAPGLYFWAETDDKAGSNGTVTFRSRWIGTGGDAMISVDRAVRLTPPNALNCHGDQFPARLDIAQRSITCERLVDQAVQVKFHTAAKGDREARVPEKIKPPVIPPPEVTTLCLSAGGFYRLIVKNGEQIQIRSAIKNECSAGGWSCDRWATSSGPDGVPNYRVGGAIDPASNIGTLLGAFSTADLSTPDGVATEVKRVGPKHVGGANNLTSSVNGYMYLIFNDIPGAFGDNAGAVWVEITRQPQFDILTDGVRLLQRR